MSAVRGVSFGVPNEGGVAAPPEIKDYVPGPDVLATPAQAAWTRPARKEQLEAAAAFLLDAMDNTDPKSRTRRQLVLYRLQKGSAWRLWLALIALAHMSMAFFEPASGPNAASSVASTSALVELLIVCVYLIDIGVHFYHSGPLYTFSSIRRVTYITLAMIYLLDVMVILVSSSSSTLGPVHFSRSLRPVTLIVHVPILLHPFSLLLKVMRRGWPILLLFVLLVFGFTVSGSVLLGGLYADPDSENGGNYAVGDFDSLSSAWAAVTELSSGNGIPDLTAIGVSLSPGSYAYFAALLVILALGFQAVFVAYVFYGLVVEHSNSIVRERLVQRKAMLYAFQTLDSTQAGFLSHIDFNRLLRRVLPHLSDSQMAAFWYSVDTEAAQSIDILKFFDVTELLYFRFVEALKSSTARGIILDAVSNEVITRRRSRHQGDDSSDEESSTPLGGSRPIRKRKTEDPLDALEERDSSDLGLVARLIKSRVYSLILFAVHVANVIWMASYGSVPDGTWVQTGALVFLPYVLDLFLRAYVSGTKFFLGSSVMFTTILVFIALVSQTLALVVGVNTPLGEVTVSISCIRLVLVMSVTNKSQALLDNIGSTSGAILGALGLIGAVVYSWTLAGMDLLPDAALPTIGEGDGTPLSFETFTSGLATTSVLLFGNRWSELYGQMAASEGGTGLVFMISFFITGTLVFTNFLIAYTAWIWYRSLSDGGRWKQDRAQFESGFFDEDPGARDVWIAQRTRVHREQDFIAEGRGERIMEQILVAELEELSTRSGYDLLGMHQRRRTGLERDNLQWGGAIRYFVDLKQRIKLGVPDPEEGGAPDAKKNKKKKAGVSIAAVAEDPVDESNYASATGATATKNGDDDGAAASLPAPDQPPPPPPSSSIVAKTSESEQGQVDAMLVAAADEYRSARGPIATGGVPAPENEEGKEATAAKPSEEPAAPAAPAGDDAGAPMKVADDVSEGGSNSGRRRSSKSSKGSKRRKKSTNSHKHRKKSTDDGDAPKKKKDKEVGESKKEEDDTVTI